MTPFYRWHPEVALRYLPIVSRLKKEGCGSVLEVGSGSLGIAPYLGWKITGVDNDFSGPTHGLISYVKSSGKKIPFQKNGFDYVISVDTFEHVSKSERPLIISEMLRVANKMIVIAAPMGQLSQKQDEDLSKTYLKKFGQDFHFLSEHKKNILPESSEIEDSIKKQAEMGNLSVKIDILSNENLKLRNFLMSGWMTKNFLVNIFFRKILLAALPIFVNMNNEPAYRKIFFVTILK